MLDFHHCAALGLNKAIVRPGPEGLQKKKKDRQWARLQKWAHSGCHAEQVPVIDCSWATSCQRGRGLVGKVTWALNRKLNTRIHPSHIDRVNERRGGGLPSSEVEVSSAVCALYTVCVKVCV